MQTLRLLFVQIIWLAIWEPEFIQTKEFIEIRNFIKNRIFIENRICRTT